LLGNLSINMTSSTPKAFGALLLVASNSFLSVAWGQQVVAADLLNMSANFLSPLSGSAITCKLPSPPDAPSVRDCIVQYREDWDRTRNLVKKKQVELLGKRNAASILQWIGVSGVATATALGLSDSGNNHTVAIVVGSAAALSGLLGTIWKNDSIEKREAACEAVLVLEPTILSNFAVWDQNAGDPEFRKAFSDRTRTEYFSLINDNLGKCGPGRPQINTLLP
jgi:hypothetical protein